MRIYGSGLRLAYYTSDVYTMRQYHETVPPRKTTVFPGGIVPLGGTVVSPGGTIPPRKTLVVLGGTSLTSMDTRTAGPFHTSDISFVCFVNHVFPSTPQT